MRLATILSFAIAICAAPLATLLGEQALSPWPEATATHKPWTRWWWHGSAVEKSEITRELESFAAAGIGGVEITPIYGVKGMEDKELIFLTEPWLEMMRFTCLEAQRLGLLVDIVPGTGWRLGREDVPPAERAVHLVLEKRQSGGLPPTYAARAAESGERVKRPAPGGSGYTIDMLDRDAVSNYLDDFNQRFFKSVPKELVRAQFHDSWEYDTDWTRNFLPEFAARRGYELLPFLEVFDPSASIDPALAERVRYDYRVTIEELILENFSENWGARTRALGLVSRNQAHGTVSNILDIYQRADIPETEIFRDQTNPLVHKFASSAAHVSGQRLVSAESFTWLSEHWQSDLAKIRRYADYLFICGINHIFFHGTAYSPSSAPWPGWVFYASTQLNDRNPIWRHLPAFNQYVARSQSLLQSGQPFHDVLLYWPISDLYSEHPGKVFKFHVDGAKWTAGEPLRETAAELLANGFQFDYVSDRQLRSLSTTNGAVSMGGGLYRAIVLPPLKRMPPETAAALAQLSTAGVPIIYAGEASPVWDAPGLAGLEASRSQLAASAAALLASTSFIAANPSKALPGVGILPESFLDGTGLQSMRRILDDGSVLYFIANANSERFDRDISLASGGSQVLAMDAWTGAVGSLPQTSGRIRLELEPHASIFLKVSDSPASGLAPWSYPSIDHTSAQSIQSPWTLTFLEGGPTLPEIPPQRSLAWLDEMNTPGLEDFAGVIRYETSFDMLTSDVSTDWSLDLGEVGSSAQIWLNGRDLGIVIQSPYRVILPADALLLTGNKLTIEVATLAANRIRHLDRTGTPWRIFQDINFVNIDYKPFDASSWLTTPTGLKGPVTLLPHRR